MARNLVLSFSSRFARSPVHVPKGDANVRAVRLVVGVNQRVSEPVPDVVRADVGEVDVRIHGERYAQP